MGHNPVGVDILFVPSTQGRRCAPTFGSVSERRWRSAVDFCPRTGVWTFLSPTGLRPKPNVVPRLRDYVGLACKHEGRKPQRGCGYFRARVDHYWSFGPHELERAMGHNPIGVDIS